MKNIVSRRLAFRRLHITSLLLSLAFISSCSSTVVKPDEYVGGAYYRVIDFRPFAENGFLFTPEKPTGEYSSKGLVQVELIPKVIEVTISEYRQYSEENGLHLDDIPYHVYKVFVTEGGNYITRYYAVSTVEIQNALKELYQLAISMDADAVVNLDMSYETVSNKGAPFTKIRVDGFAIKRN